MHWHDLPKQPTIFISYWNVNKLLYSALILFIFETVFYFFKVQMAIQNERLEIVAFWMWCLLFSFVHIFLVLMDGWSRFQNYKRIKDHMFQHGFTTKMARQYSGSKCQRMAVVAAAKELGIEEHAKRYFHKIGVRWYHFIPQFMVYDPLFTFKKHFWSRTFMEAYYRPKYDFKRHQNVTTTIDFVD